MSKISNAQKTIHDYNQALHMRNMLKLKYEYIIDTDEMLAIFKMLCDDRNISMHALFEQYDAKVKEFEE
jgi:hypothetical protein